MKEAIPILMTLAMTIDCSAQNFREPITPAAPVPAMPVATATVRPTEAPVVVAESDPLPYLPDGCPSAKTGVTKWSSKDPANLSTDQLFSLSYSRCTWSVSTDGSELIASPHETVPPEIPTVVHPPPALGAPRRILRRQPGYLVGFNRGEWGGMLLWYAPNGKLKGKLVGENVVELLPGAQSTVALFGLAHLGGDYGRAVEIVESTDKFSVTRSVDLGSAPSAALRKTPTSILVATHDGLLEINANFTVTTLIVSKWGMLYPTSVTVTPDDAVYIGMRGIVAEVKKIGHTYVERWLLPVPIN